MEDKPRHHGTKRIYRYVDQFGTEFWSFTRLPHHVFRQLSLEEFRGEHFRKHLARIQREALGLDDENPK